MIVMGLYYKLTMPIIVPCSVYTVVLVDVVLKDLL